MRIVLTTRRHQRIEEECAALDRVLYRPLDEHDREWTPEALDQLAAMVLAEPDVVDGA